MNMHLYLQRKYNSVYGDTYANYTSGSDRHKINFFNVNSAFLNSIDVSSRFLHIQQHRSPVASMVFHPHKMILAYSTLNDNHINLTTCIPPGKVAPEASLL